MKRKLDKKSTLAQACALAGIPTPTTAAGVADAYMRLLVERIDHGRVDKPDWFDAMLFDAPCERL